uniref:Uncharacterized protein n=1 Tax=Anguilla anguilla TaxID=7936 RepID=A0A0E9S5I8_ANGAN
MKYKQSTYSRPRTSFGCCKHSISNLCTRENIAYNMLATNVAYTGRS